LWIVYGAIAILLGLAAKSSSEGLAYLNFLFGAMFLISGIQVLYGKASQVIGSGITCLLLAAGTVVSYLALAQHADDVGGRIPSWLTNSFVLNAAILGLAGILAIMGDAQYRQWVQHKKTR
jgi:hypothetical protein